MIFLKEHVSPDFAVCVCLCDEEEERGRRFITFARRYWRVDESFRWNETKSIKDFEESSAGITSFGGQPLYISKQKSQSRKDTRISNSDFDGLTGSFRPTLLRLFIIDPLLDLGHLDPQPFCFIMDVQKCEPNSTYTHKAPKQSSSSSSRT